MSVLANDNATRAAYTAGLALDLHESQYNCKLRDIAIAITIAIAIVDGVTAWG